MTAGEGCQYLTVREIYVPGGNWYPHPPLMTEDTEILHLYKFDRPAGLAMQRLYGAEGRDDQTLTVRHDDVVAIASGSYSAAVAPGSAAYILSVTYGTPRSGAVDPAWKWWNDLPPGRDPRLPIVDRGMEP
jgi:5-deoxy-D-glucuronate isomerase